MRVNRRKFLKGLGITGAVLGLGVYFGTPYAQLKIAENVEDFSTRASMDTAPDVWLGITPENTVILRVNKSEMGQGIHTAMAQFALEELGIAASGLQVVQASSSTGAKNAFGTGGSTSVATTFAPVRQAAATLRVLLLSAAEKALGTTALQMVGNTIQAKSNAQNSITFAELSQTEGFWTLPETLPTPKTSGLKVLGKSLPRVDMEAKVRGEAQYGYDAKAKNMLYGAVAKPNTLAGKIKSVNPKNAAQMAGIKKLVIDGNFVGVAAETRDQARAALAAMDIQWDEGKLWQQSEILAMIDPNSASGIAVQRSGNVAKALNHAKPITAEYHTPFAIQMAMEPQAALAEVGKDGATIWASTQHPNGVASAVAKALGFKPEAVEVMPMYLGGGFGSKLTPTVALEAARLAKAVGQPVHVGWTREEEALHNYIRPPTHSVFQAALSGKKISALEHRVGSGVVAFSSLPGFLGTVMGADFGSYLGGRTFYDIPNVQTTSHNPTLPVKTGWWRGLGLFANTFALESFIDELAYSAGVDAVDFRLQHLPETAEGKRLRKVLTAVTQQSRWGRSQTDRALGVALGSSAGTVCAHVAEVGKEGGKIKIHAMYCALDCGLVINPDGAKAQIEGAILWGLGSSLLEKAEVKDGKLQSSNFSDYPILGFADTPEVNITLHEDGSGVPHGLGEPPMAGVGAAIGNAIFALTGKRQRTLPFDLGLI